MGIETVRIDQWLWCVRITKTRADAAGLCRSGRVKIGGKVAKPSSAVKVGDRIEARVHHRERVFEVQTLISKRVGANIAVDCYIDHSPPEPDREVVPHVFERDRGAGRPTKKDRRELDKLRGRTRR